MAQSERNEYKGIDEARIRDEFILKPWCQSSANDQPVKDDGYFSKVYDHAGHRQNYKGAAHNKVSSSIQLAVYRRSNGLAQNKDPSDASKLAVYRRSNGLAKNKDPSDASQLAIFNRSTGSPKREDVSPKREPPLKDRNSPVSIGMQQPQYTGSPKKDHGYDKSIHNKASHPARAYARDNYKGIAVDAKEATEKIQGRLIMTKTNHRCGYY